jgi:hypothetical protein
MPLLGSFRNFLVGGRCGGGHERRCGITTMFVPAEYRDSDREYKRAGIWVRFVIFAWVERAARDQLKAGCIRSIFVRQDHFQRS